MADIIDFNEYRNQKKRHKKRKKLRKAKSPNHNKRKRKRRISPKPDRQGHLDSLCGLYSIVNALSTVKRFNDVDRERIFRRLIKTLEKDQSASDAIVYGTCKKQMDAMIKEAVHYVKRKHHVRIAIKPLFKNPSNINVDSYWRVLRQFLSESNRRSIIIGIHGAHDHWTCARSVSQFTMKLYDSSGFKCLRRRSCRIGKPYTDNRYHLLPTQTWGISLTD